MFNVENKNTVMKKTYIAPHVEAVKINTMPLLSVVSGEIEGDTNRAFSVRSEFGEIDLAEEND